MPEVDFLDIFSAQNVHLVIVYWMDTVIDPVEAVQRRKVSRGVPFVDFNLACCQPNLCSD